MTHTLALLIALLLAPTAARPVATRAKPNILHIHADDHRPDGLRALGNPLLVTPNLDSLAERGMVFTRCYTMGSMVGAVCTPSRTMMLTGLVAAHSWRSTSDTQRQGPNDFPAANHPGGWLPHVAHGEGWQWFPGGSR